MKATPLFTISGEAFQVSKIIFAGAVEEIPEDLRKGKTTHSFRIITFAGSKYCYFTSEESAKKVRAALGAILDAAKKNLFRSQGQSLDPMAVISFGNVVAFKNPADNKSHGFTVTLETGSEKNSQIWCAYGSIETAEKARKGLYASIMEANGFSREKIEKTPEEMHEGELVGAH